MNGNSSVWDYITSKNTNGQFEIEHDSVLGVDFGTSNSCLSIWNISKNKVKIVKNIDTKGKTMNSIC